MSNAALEKARLAMAEKRAAGEVVRLDPIEKARQNPKSLRLAITAKCWECMGGGEESGARRMIRECTSAGCPLHAQRPYQNSENGDAS
ncbi:hypothetical protein PRZ61_10600 [Halomonas pacifica]|uniref:Uncharacterized protein n=1 Tax=Bisbaumannia pacifica TaxID=77098 RepID=A0A510XBV4_9GAMM|nr:hypothetical protein [Halomonas pacifica]MDC8803884.1 hypothetical protein [Halomonas pacifica]GEK48942.1 hypothetical protein HPA02_32250 [Halomonas pacifica]